MWRLRRFLHSPWISLVLVCAALDSWILSIPLYVWGYVWLLVSVCLVHF